MTKLLFISAFILCSSLAFSQQQPVKPDNNKPKTEIKEVPKAQQNQQQIQKTQVKKNQIQKTQIQKRKAQQITQRRKAIQRGRKQ